MHSRIYRPLAAVLAAAVVIAAPASGGTPAKQPPVGHAAARLTVTPGDTVRWRSPRIGAVRRIYVRINGGPASYSVVPHTNRCVGYIYGGGVAARITDCSRGRRAPYLRIRATSAALNPVRLVVRLNNG